MAAVGTGGVQVESRGLAKNEEREQRLLSMRLPASDVSALRFFFGGLESLMGLGSNFGAMCERLQSQTAGGRWNEDGHARAQATHIDGAEMHVKHAMAPCARTDRLQPVEGWACWSNHTDGSLGDAVCEAHDTLVRMVERGDKVHVIVLWLMYGKDTPIAWTRAFPQLGELVPLACETATVLRHAEKMTADLRNDLAISFRESRMEGDALDSRRPCPCGKHVWALCPQRPGPRPVALDPHFQRIRGEQPRRERVEPYEALSHLLGTAAGEKKRPDAQQRHAQRERVATEIRIEAAKMLIAASNAYVRARRA